MKIQMWTNKKKVVLYNGKIYGGIYMNNLKSFNLHNFIVSKNPTIISSNEALKDVEPIKWNESVLSGKNKILIDSNK
ncbi:hypothetical protein Ctaglu_20670 [Clostridium tagluense]|uniref:Uncharacterized protein n=2 Tax=Clostridium tagluense TaxID=360422 RepID=A0A401ULN6_9CLOT|nr:hypothetical protein Ctaglu_20670 [Clostridium tagluense]